MSVVDEDTPPPPRTRSKYWLLSALVFSGSLLLIAINNGSQVLQLRAPARPSWRLSAPIQTSNTTLTQPHATFCVLPSLQPLPEELQPLVKFPANLAPCPNQQHPLLRSNSTHIWIETSSLQYYNVTNEQALSCCYRSFHRPLDVQDVTSHHNDDRVLYDACTHFTSHVRALHEFVQVNCSVAGTHLYTQYFIFAPKKPITLYDDAKPAPANESSYNVIVLGIDNVSRMNLHRTMPLTVAALQRLGAVELQGYNKVGDNSYPNLVALLLGHEEHELAMLCHPFKHRPFDECPFAWYAYKRAGYYTAMAEDTSYLGTFNYLLDGFLRQPADYYAHPFVHEAERTVGTNKDFNAFLCMNDRYFYQVLLDYIENVTSTLSHNRLFGFFWEVTMSHDYANYPMVMDRSYEGLLQRLAASGYLEQTVVLMMSDHGIRWGPVRATRQGQLEERLPFVFVLVPSSFRSRHRVAFRNLQLNAGSLTTPFDVHATLLNLADLTTLHDDRILARMQESYASSRGISLFLPIPTNRTCAAAGIAEHWCTCRRGRAVPRDSAVAGSAALALVHQLNALLRDHQQCASLVVAEVLRASELEGGVGARELTVAVRASPGGGHFEGTLVARGEQWLPAGGAPSRLNLYGNQSHCVDDPHLKLYCYCK